MSILELTIGNLNVKVLETREELGNKAATEAIVALHKVIRDRGECNVVFAAAPSQNEFLAQLCSSDVDWTKVNAFHMDEYIGLSDDAPQRFANFLTNAIFDHLPFKSVNLINGNADSIEDEIDRYTALLKSHPLDIVFMGIGENGHIAFNDPHVSHFDDTCLMKIVDLDTKCRQQQVNDGCFSKLEDVPENALTLTVPALISAKKIFCMVPAATKAVAVREAVYGEIREMFPASVLRMHSRATLYVDMDSGKYILNNFGVKSRK